MLPLLTAVEQLPIVVRVRRVIALPALIAFAINNENHANRHKRRRDDKNQNPTAQGLNHSSAGGGRLRIAERATLREGREQGRRAWPVATSAMLISSNGLSTPSFLLNISSSPTRIALSFMNHFENGAPKTIRKLSVHPYCIPSRTEIVKMTTNQQKGSAFPTKDA